MNNNNKYTSSFILRVVIIVAAFLTLFCMALPFYSYYIEVSGFSVITDIVDSRRFPEFPELGAPIALGTSVICLIFAFFILLKDKLVIFTMLSSIASIVMMYIGLSEDMDYLGTGYYLYLLMHLAIVVLSIAALCLPKSKPSPTQDQSSASITNE